MQRKNLIIAGSVLLILLLMGGGWIAWNQFFANEKTETVNDENVMPAERSSEDQKVDDEVTEAPPANMDETPGPKLSVSWTASIGLFVVPVPENWNLWQADSGAGSAVVFEADAVRTSLGISFSFEWLGGLIPESARRENVTLGNKSAVKATDASQTYYLIKDVYSQEKQANLDVFIKYENTDPQVEVIERIVASVIFEPSEEQMRDAKIIP